MTIDEAISNERKIIEKCKTEYELECARYGKRTVESFGKLECIKVAAIISASIKFHICDKN